VLRNIPTKCLCKILKIQNLKMLRFYLQNQQGTADRDRRDIVRWSRAQVD